jgi:hypothetical protein
MAEKKEKKLVAADEKTKTAAKEVEKNMKQSKPVGDSAPLRIGAIICWIFALLCEVGAYLILVGKFNLKFLPSMWQIIIMLVLDLILIIVGASFWKKANHISPASEKNKLKFWLWNNMGVLVTVICFVPFLVLLLLNKDLDKKTKGILCAVAVVAMLLAGAGSYDYNPVSEEMQKAAVQTLGDETVYWAPFGKVYHTHKDCQALNQSDTLTYGTVAEAIAANRSRLCAFCARKDEITGVATDE